MHEPMYIVEQANLAALPALESEDKSCRQAPGLQVGSSGHARQTQSEAAPDASHHPGLSGNELHAARLREM